MEYLNIPVFEGNLQYEVPLQLICLAIRSVRIRSFSKPGGVHDFCTEANLSETLTVREL